MSEAHIRQLQMFNENPAAFVDKYSQDFLEGYTSLLRLRFNGRRVHSNEAYKEYIQERHHIHMYSTIWETLTEFVNWLGQNNICKIDHTEKGWFVTYIDKNPWQIGKKKIDERDELERERDFIKNQVERGKDEETFKKPDTIASSLKRKRTDEKIQLALKVNKTKPKTPSVSRDGVDDSVRKAFKMKKKRKSGGEEDPMEGWSIEDVKDKMFAVEALVAKDPTNLKNIEELKKQVERMEMLIEREKLRVIQEEEEEDATSSSEDESDDDSTADERRSENWICRGIVVKVMAKNLGHKYHKQKGQVRDMSNKFTAIVTMLDSGTKVKLDQSYLETVIPAIGKRVIVCNGRKSGAVALLKDIDKDIFCGVVEADDGDVIRLPYEDFSKAFDQDPERK